MVANVRSGSPVVRPISIAVWKAASFSARASANMPSVSATHPRSLDVGSVAQQGLRPGDPPAGHRPIAGRRAVQVAQGPRHPRRTRPVPLLAVAGVGPLELRDRPRILQQHIRRRGQTLEHLRREVTQLELRPRAGPVAHPQRGTSQLDLPH